MSLRQRLRSIFADWYAAAQERRRIRRLLNDQGFVVFCECGKVLNTNPAEDSPSYGVYTYKCATCGTRTTFDMCLAPAPVKVETPCDSTKTSFAMS